MAKKIRYPHRLQLRLGDVHMEVLDRARELHAIREHDYIRSAILNLRIAASPPPPPTINLESATLLSKMSANVNQIARRWNQHPLGEITREEIDNLNAALAYVAAQLLGHTSCLDRIMEAGFARIIEMGEAQQ